MMMMILTNFLKAKGKAQKSNKKWDGSEEDEDNSKKVKERSRVNSSGESGDESDEFLQSRKGQKKIKNKPGPNIESGNEDDDSSFKIKTVAQKKAEKKERERKKRDEEKRTAEAERKEELETGKRI